MFTDFDPFKYLKFEDFAFMNNDFGIFERTIFEVWEMWFIYSKYDYILINVMVSSFLLAMLTGLIVKFVSIITAYRGYQKSNILVIVYSALIYRYGSGVVVVGCYFLYFIIGYLGYTLYYMMGYGI